MKARARRATAPRPLLALPFPIQGLRGNYMDAGTQLARSQDIGVKIGMLARKRTETAVKHFTERVETAVDAHDGKAGKVPQLLASANPWNMWQYMVDAGQRSILFWDTMRQRGNDYLAHATGDEETVLHFEHEPVLDARSFERPVNYAMVRIKPPEGVIIDPKRRPYVLIDPRAGHGPGIGGFKDDSQVGVALKAGHPVYFVIFFRNPEPGQTLLDVCAAEQQFVHKVRELHPDSPKPAIVGNCQGGWAAMMLGSSSPEDTGPIVINGAPMSYWGGAWSEGEGDNPMRYSGGILGGSWLASYTADLGNGKFDGAWLVHNFENLNPANTLWNKYYNLYSKVDTEPPRFLEFERWWGSYYLMNREEIEWITKNLFVGNKLWSGDVKSAAGTAFDLRDIRSPIILFASMGDNITPPQQAFNWVADLYGSTDEIKARGQVIVGLMHQSVGHLGIFVSGAVAKKEHAQIVSVLKTIEMLPPGLYGMEITEHPGEDGKVAYEVDFIEHQLEDIVQHFNRFKRTDEKPFEAVEAVSEFNQRAYELFAQPMVQATSNEWSARMLRTFHPLRVQHWALSDLNPWMAWLGPAAQAVKANRKAVEPDQPLRQLETIGSEMINASLDFYRAMRDAVTETSFFGVYANMFSMYMADKHEAEARRIAPPTEPRELPYVREALASISEGGYPAAFARIGALLMRHGEPLPLARLETKDELSRDYAEYVPKIPPDQLRRIRGEQEIIVRYEPEQAVLSLSTLLADPRERNRLLTLLDKLITDTRVLAVQPTPAQLQMLARIRFVLGAAQGAPALERRIHAVPVLAPAVDRRTHAMAGA
jgi:pimeloyl-ACP methyl ester carboxylesterase